MPFYTSPLDGCQLHYVDYLPNASTSITLIFLHGWPMSSSMFSHLFLPLLDHKIRIIAADRRGFGRSEWSGEKHIDVAYGTFAFDTVALVKMLCDGKHGGLGDFMFVGASMGCGETLLCYNMLKDIGKAKSKCKGFVWMGPSLPFPLKTDANLTAPPRELWDAILGGLRADRHGFTKAAMPGIFGHGTVEGVEISEDNLRAYGDLVAQADPVAMEKCIDIITNKDFTQELKDVAGDIGEADGKVRLLILHGDSDQSMPYEASTKLVKELAPGIKVKLYEKAAHGLYLTHKDQVLKDMLQFIDEGSKTSSAE